MASRLSSFLAELKRRRVWRVAVAYGATALGAALAVAELYNDVGLPEGTPRVVIIVLAVGFPVALLLSWAYDITPEGLRATRSAPSSHAVGDPKSVAVLPLKNIGSDPDNEFFSDGLTEDIIAQLSHIEGLRVISRTSVMHFKHTTESLSSIAAALSVGTVLEGSVRRAGNRIRVVVQLIDASSDTHLWAETYDRDLTDVFAIQSDVALRVSSALRAVLSEEEKERVTRAPTTSMEAYNRYLLGRYHLNKRTQEGLRSAVAHFRDAIGEDGGYAAPHTGLADAYVLLSSGTYGPAPEGAIAEATTAALRALELDETLAEAHTSLAFVRFRCDWAWAEAEREFLRAIELNPSAAAARQWFAIYLSAMGRHDEARREIETARKLDPLSLIVASGEGRIAHFAGRYTEAIEHFRRTLEMDPTFAQAHFDLSMTYIEVARYTEALEEIDEAIRLGGPKGVLTAEKACALARSGRADEARRILTHLEEGAVEDSLPKSDLALVYVGLDERERALDLLEWGMRDRDGALVYLKVSPEFDPLRSDPRFQQLMRGMNFPL